MVHCGHLSAQRITVNQGSLNISRGEGKGLFTKQHWIPKFYEIEASHSTFDYVVNLRHKV